MKAGMEDHVQPVLDVPGEESPPVSSTDHKTKVPVQFPTVAGEVFRRDYVKHEVIGTGKATVHKAQHKATGNLVAAKEMNKLEEARKEASWFVKLNHPNILTVGNVSTPECKLTGEKLSVEVEDTDESSIDKPHIHYIIMELCLCTLFDKLIELSNNEELTDAVRYNLFNQIYTGLAYMHRKGFTHNDIHINNIFVKYVKGKLIAKYGDLADVSRDKYEDRVAGDLFNFGKILLQLFHPNPRVFAQSYKNHKTHKYQWQLHILSKAAKKRDVPPKIYPGRYMYSPNIWNLIRELMWTHHLDDPEQMDNSYPCLGIKQHIKKEPQHSAREMDYSVLSVLTLNEPQETNTSEIGAASDHNATGSSSHTPQAIAEEKWSDEVHQCEWQVPLICRLVEKYIPKKAEAALEDTDNASISDTAVQDPIESNSVSTIDKHNVPSESDTPASQINISNSESDGIAVDC